MPDWFRDHCPAAFSAAESSALLARAPLWLRLQTKDSAVVFEEFAAQSWQWRMSSLLSPALEFLSEADVIKSQAYQRGLIEIQDLGSQLNLAAVGVSAGEHWLDACAGAGGKTLQLAALLGGEGQIDAHDVRPAALIELAERARRAKISVIPHAARAPHASAAPRNSSASTASIRIQPTLAATALYDGVLVDAPCSGSGTWRRAPHLKWTTTPEQITAAANLQKTLLGTFSANVRPGGRLVYATCSLSRVENEDVVAAFLAAHPNFSLQPLADTFGFTPGKNGLPILPARHNTDGFFVAALRRN